MDKSKKSILDEQILSDIKSYLEYNKDTGIFIWIKLKVKNKVKIGDVAGSYDKNNGYFRIKFKDKLFALHRLAWFYTYGVIPNKLIDHINGIKTDNRIVNLRCATIRQNLENQIKARKDNKTGYLGVCYRRKENIFTASIRVNKKLIHLGYFKTAKEAHEAYLASKRQLHEFCTI